jgi:single-stranded-DNA-specific exonuclease
MLRSKWAFVHHLKQVVIMTSMGIDPTPSPHVAAMALTEFLTRYGASERLVALHDVDADGVAAGVVWQRACERLGMKSPCRLIPDRERNAWSQNTRERLVALHPDALFVMDLGSQPVPVLPGVPTCYIDHHRPGGVPGGDTLISAYTWDPVPNTSLMIYDLFSPMIDISDLDWIAAIGTISDLGERAPFSIIASTKKSYMAKYLKEATTLVNAVRRASNPNPEAAARALLSHPGPRELVQSSTRDVELLRAAREEVRIALDEAKKAAPVFSGPVALIRVRSACQIHPLIAQIWRSRLPKFIVIAANDGYVRGRINFSARAAQGTNVLEFLRAIQLSPGEGAYGHGHDGASGGSLPPERWHELLQKLGFTV